MDQLSSCRITSRAAGVLIPAGPPNSIYTRIDDHQWKKSFFTNQGKTFEEMIRMSVKRFELNL